MAKEDNNIATFRERKNVERTKDVMKSMLTADGKAEWFLSSLINIGGIATRRVYKPIEGPNFGMEWQSLEMTCDWKLLFSAVLNGRI